VQNNQKSSSSSFLASTTKSA